MWYVKTLIRDRGDSQLALPAYFVTCQNKHTPIQSLSFYFDCVVGATWYVTTRFFGKVGWSGASCHLVFVTITFPSRFFLLHWSHPIFFQKIELSWLISMLRPTKNNERPVGHPPHTHKFPNGLANRVEPEQSRLKNRKKILVFMNKSVWIAAEGEWRAVAPGLKPLHLPRAHTWH